MTPFCVLLTCPSRSCRPPDFTTFCAGTWGCLTSLLCFSFFLDAILWARLLLPHSVIQQGVRCLCPLCSHRLGIWMSCCASLLTANTCRQLLGDCWPLCFCLGPFLPNALSPSLPVLVSSCCEPLGVGSPWEWVTRFECSWIYWTSSPTLFVRENK